MAQVDAVRWSVGTDGAAVAAGTSDADPLDGSWTQGSDGLVPGWVEPAALDVQEIRRHFLFPGRGRIVTNNAASTQPPRELVQLYAELAPGYENVHRGQSDASMQMTARFERSWQDIADFLGAPGIDCLALYRGTTEAINAVMYSLLTQFRDGDNLVTTLLEHNSNYVPWHALCREILPRFGVQVECRLVGFDPVSGRLDLDQLADAVDERTKLVCCTGASNFLGTKPPLAEVKMITDRSGYRQPNGERRSWLLVDGAQLVPSTPVDVVALGVDYLAFSFHKLLAPFGIGVLYGRSELLEDAAPFLYGGDMIAEDGVYRDHVDYNRLPWKYAAGTPNVLGTIVSAQALRLLLDLTLRSAERTWFGGERPITNADARRAMGRVAAHLRTLTEHVLGRVRSVPGITVYGPDDAAGRGPLVAFNVAGRSPFEVASALNAAGVESRAGCHCAALAHRHLRLDPPASCRLSFALYNSLDDADAAVDALVDIAR
jgi:cysteine desulfurase/selenocysteine lyase